VIVCTNIVEVTKMDSENTALRQAWEELKQVVSDLALDVEKNIRGNQAAGGRARKGLRALKKVASVMVKESVSADKARKSQKSAS
jgi:hypothetical protein